LESSSESLFSEVEVDDEDEEGRLKQSRVNKLYLVGGSKCISTFNIVLFVDILLIKGGIMGHFGNTRGIVEIMRSN